MVMVEEKGEREGKRGVGRRQRREERRGQSIVIVQGKKVTYMQEGREEFRIEKDLGSMNNCLVGGYTNGDVYGNVRWCLNLFW